MPTLLITKIVKRLPSPIAVVFLYLGGDAIPVNPRLHVQLLQRKDNLCADLAAEGKVVAESLQVNAQSVRQFNHLKKLFSIQH